jgi:thioredoxin-dependent peroxiredoxin
LTSAHQLATPADWLPGEDVIITPAVSQQEAARRFPDHRTIKPYLRMTAQPAPAGSRGGRPASA